MCAILGKFAQMQAGGYSLHVTCYVLHHDSMLAMIHIILMSLAGNTVTIIETLAFTPMNSNFWPVMSSVLLHALHSCPSFPYPTACDVNSACVPSEIDISGTCAAFGSALSSVWTQIDIPASYF